MRRVHLLPLLSIAALLAVGGCARPSMLRGVVLPAPGETRHTLTLDGRERSFLVYVPASLDLSRPVPLVLVFHGGTGNARSAARMSGMNAVADEHGFVAVYPNGTGPLDREALLTWNAGGCCGYAREHEVDDVGFARAIVADLASQMEVDPDRVYAAGMSNGAMMAQRLGCEAADVFAGIAPVAGTLNFEPCEPTRPVSVIEFHGTADTHVPYDGGYGPDSLVHVDFAAVADSVGFWVSADGCPPGVATASAGAVRHDSWTGCSDETAVELYTADGGGHAWPGGRAGWPGSDEPAATLSASELIWEFFAAHPRFGPALA